MKKLILGCGLLAVTMAGPVSAGPAPAEPDCCACFIPDHDSAVPAFFCTSPSSVPEMVAAENRCGDIPGAELLCTEKRDVNLAPATEGCVSDLMEMQIICPSERAPALGNMALASLAVLLATLGAWVVRRRALGSRS